MWKRRKKAIIGLSVAGVLVIVSVTGFPFRKLIEQRRSNPYLPHLVLGDTVYWYGWGYPGEELPEGVVEIARITAEVERPPTKVSGEGWDVRPGAPVYGNEDEFGWVYIESVEGGWIRFVPKELNKCFLRYDGSLYLPEPHVRNIPGWQPLFYREQNYAPTGEVTYYPDTWDVLPQAHCAVSLDTYIGEEIMVNPKRPDRLVTRRNASKSEEPVWHYTL